MLRNLINTTYHIHYKIQTQPPEVFLNILQYSQGNESLFTNVAGLQACNFIKNRPQHRFVSVNTLRTESFAGKIFRGNNVRDLDQKSRK